MASACGMPYLFRVTPIQGTQSADQPMGSLLLRFCLVNEEHSYKSALNPKIRHRIGLCMMVSSSTSTTHTSFFSGHFGGQQKTLLRPFLSQQSSSSSASRSSSTQSSAASCKMFLQKSTIIFFHYSLEEAIVCNARCIVHSSGNLSLI